MNSTRTTRALALPLAALAATCFLMACSDDGGGEADAADAADTQAGDTAADTSPEDAADAADTQAGDTGADTSMEDTEADAGPDVADAGDAGPSDAGPDATDAGPDAEDATDAEDGDVTPPDLRPGELTLRDFLSGAPVAGAELTAGFGSATTGADGSATVQVPTWAPYQITGTAAGYHDNHWFGFNDDEGFSLSSLVVSKAASATLAGALGLSLDPAKGLVFVSVLKQSAADGTLSDLGGVTVDLDAAYAVALVQDASAPLGLAPGQTTVHGSPATVIFVNATAGEAVASLTPPDGHACTVFPGDEATMDLEILGDAVSRIVFVCTADAAQATFTLTDYASGAPLEGADLTAGGDAVTTDAEGKATLAVDTWLPYQVTATLAGYPDNHWFGFNDGEGFATGGNLVSDATAATLAGALGLTLSPEKGMAFVSAFKRSAVGGPLTPLAGVAVDLDAAYDVALVPDEASPLGLSVGNTTLPGSDPTTIFVNVEAGALAATPTPPDGYACTVFPGDVPALEMTVFGDAVSRMSFMCASPALDAGFSLTDYTTSAPIEGVELVSGSELATTDADGKATVPVDSLGTYHVVGTVPGYPEQHWFGETADADFTLDRLVVSDATIAALAGALGLTLDPGKGFVFVTVPSGVSGTTLDLDVPYDVALVRDANSPLGLSVGNALVGAGTSVIFANVGPGPVAATITAADGYTCAGFPAGGATLAAEVYGGAVSRLNFDCTPLPVEAQVTLVDFSTGAGVEGVSLTAGDPAVTTDASGYAAVTLDAWASYHLYATVAGYPDNHFYGRAGAGDFALSRAIVSDADLAALAGSLGVALDATEGLVFVTIDDELGGVTVDLDASYDVALVQDAGSPLGLSLGNTTLPGSPTTVIFVNVAEGVFTPTVTPPDGYTCGVYPGGGDATPAACFAGAVSRVTYGCAASP